MRSSLDADGPIWREGGRRYRIVRPELVTYPRSEIRKIDGRNVRVSLPPVEYTICSLELIGDDSALEQPRAPGETKGRKLVQSARKR